MNSDPWDGWGVMRQCVARPLLHVISGNLRTSNRWRNYDEWARFVAQEDGAAVRRNCPVPSGAPMSPLPEGPFCPQCDNPITYAGNGRRRTYCSTRCRQASHRASRRAQEQTERIHRIHVDLASTVHVMGKLLGEMAAELEALSGQTADMDSPTTRWEGKTADLADRMKWAADKVMQLAREHKALITGQGNPESAKTAASQYTNPAPCGDDRDPAIGQPCARPQTLPDETADPVG